jgi:UDP-N-acetylmuramate: L-alanyl-gamma-D-glutamyl-meso-diaminopimelate ligase
LPWDAAPIIAQVRGQAHVAHDVEALLQTLGDIAQPGDHVVFMSNGGFDGAPRRFLAQLS